MTSRLQDCGRSLRALPRWVQVWIGGFLIPVNTLPFFMLDTPTGKAAALAAIFVVLTNVPIMLQQRGMSRLMSVPHLIAWVPLLGYLGARVLFGPDMSGIELLLATALILINGASLVFDTLDSWRWLCGARDIPGHLSQGACK